METDEAVARAKAAPVPVEKITAPRNFRQRNDGAVTVDWVVLTAAIIAITVLGFSGMKDAVLDLTDLITDFMKSWTFT